ncbi:8761_t:CDS:2, partial [Cetraspora pellucida]
MTITGKETTQEIFKKDQDFSFTESSDVKILLGYVFPNLLKVDKSTDKALKVVKNIFIVNLNHLTSKLQQHITNTIDSYIGECVEPKVISNPYELVITMISTIAANLIVGDLDYRVLYEIPLRFISNHRDVIISRIKPVVKKRLEAKKKLGDAWIAPVDALQLLLNDPNIAPDFDPDNVNYDYIADLTGLFIFAAMSTTTVRASHALH